MKTEVELIHLKETNSTNRYLRQLMQEKSLSKQVVVVADYQTKGLGQVGNYWESARGENLLFSLLLFPHEISLDSFFVLSQLVSLSIKQVLDKYTDEITIKWPNDIYWKDKKIAGILIENDIASKEILQSIVGVGININQTDFQSDAPNPISLKQILHKEYEPFDILYDFLTAFQAMYLRFLHGEEKTLSTMYRQSLYRGEGYHPFEDEEGTFEARVSKVDSLGFLYLEDCEGRMRKYAFKEVRYK